jgi:putative transposase
MRDHLHRLIDVPGDGQLSNLIRDFKRITTRIAGIDWQRNCFDHRLRHDESENEKVAYIRANPVRGGLTGPNDHWPFASRLCPAYRLLPFSTSLPFARNEN